MFLHLCVSQSGHSRGVCVWVWGCVPLGPEGGVYPLDTHTPGHTHPWTHPSFYFKPRGLELCARIKTVKQLYNETVQSTSISPAKDN